MSETTMTLVGNAATEVRFRETPAGVPVASFRLASTARRWDRGKGGWVDAHTSFYTVWAWRVLAENVAGSVGKGDPLIVRGRVRVREWESEGRRNTTVEIEAAAVGHDLSRGTSAFRRIVRPVAPAGPDTEDGRRAPAQQLPGLPDLGQGDPGGQGAAVAPVAPVAAVG